MKQFLLRTVFSLASLLLLGGFILPVSFVSAQGIDVNEQFNTTLKNSGLQQKSADSAGKDAFTGALGSIINQLIGLMGIATFVLVIYAGSLWILAAGNDDKIEQSKKILQGCVLGLIIIFSAYILVNYSLTALQKAITGQ